MRQFVLFSALFLSACATSPKDGLSQIQVGMDKDQVLDKIGDPKRTFRSTGKDHWIYVYYANEQEVRQQVDFSDGKVIKVNPPRTKSQQSLSEELESAETMEEFEQKARQHKSHNP